jgi:5-deoxy-glucuronate isomerase
LVQPLAGGPASIVRGVIIELEGRSSVFARVTDFAYLPMGAAVSVTAPPAAVMRRRHDEALEPRYGKAEDVPAELRVPGRHARSNFAPLMRSRR